MPTMRVAQVAQPGGKFEIVEREIPSSAAGRGRSEACERMESGKARFRVVLTTGH